MKRSILVAAAVLLGATAVVAQTGPIAQRQAIMKGVGAATRTGTQMSRGEVPFDLAKAKEILQVYADAAARTHQFFPAGSQTGGDTSASPKIWENQADFRAKFDAWGKQIEQASKSVTDAESFKTAFGDLTKACGGCHQPYRLNKS